VAGVRDPESIAEHSFRCAWIGYFLALAEGANTARVVMMGLAHDVPEARLNDQHKVGQRYLDPKPAEARVFSDQVADLPAREELAGVHAEYAAGATLEARVARDADRLECAFQALEYVEEGHRPCRDWFVNAEDALVTAGGKSLFAALEAGDPNAWYRDLPGHTRR
jgi:putative hydrolase of HD superfamily